jgi:quinol monooxygenase YgiN
MWVQLIKAKVKPGTDLSALTEVLKAAEQPDTGLLREMFMHDQNDPSSVYVLAIFENEEKAREREQDPRRAEGQQAVQAFLADALAAPPEFIELTVTTDWSP